MTTLSIAAQAEKVKSDLDNGKIDIAAIQHLLSQVSDNKPTTLNPVNRVDYWRLKIRQGEFNKNYKAM